MKRIGAATALEVRATGIPYVFAPCIAVNLIMNPTSDTLSFQVSAAQRLLLLPRFAGTHGGVGVTRATARMRKLCSR